jgi:hypothetical protein
MKQFKVFNEAPCFSIILGVVQDTMYNIPVASSLKNVDLFLRLTLLPGNAIDRQLEFVERAFRYSNSGSALFTR